MAPLVARWHKQWIARLMDGRPLTLEEKLQVAKIALEAADGRIPVLANVSETSTRNAIRYVEAAAKLGATPVGMPVPAVTDALTKGTIAGTTIPWEVTPALKVSELVKNHTTFAGPTGLFTQTFALVMNRASYDKLPANLKAVIDKNAGVETAAFFGRAMDDGDKAGMDVARKAGNSIVTLDAAETQEYDALKLEAKQVGEHIARLKEHEAHLVETATPIRCISNRSGLRQSYMHSLAIGFMSIACPSIAL